MFPPSKKEEACFLIIITTWPGISLKKIKDNKNMLLRGKYQRYLTCKLSEVKTNGSQVNKNE